MYRDPFKNDFRHCCVSHLANPHFEHQEPYFKAKLYMFYYFLFIEWFVLVFNDRQQDIALIFALLPIHDRF